MSKETFQNNVTHPKDPGSALTHFIGVILVILAALPLLFRAAKGEHPIYLLSLSIFAVSMLLLYSASTIYHTFNLSEKTNRILKQLDHIMIYVLIAGSYTPVCLITLQGAGGTTLFLLVWSVALLGILQCIFFINCPKWVSSIPRARAFSFMASTKAPSLPRRCSARAQAASLAEDTATDFSRSVTVIISPAFR